LAEARDDIVGIFQAVGNGMITRIERCCVRFLLSHDFRFRYESFFFCPGRSGSIEFISL